MKPIEKVTLSISQWNGIQEKNDAMKETIAHYESKDIQTSPLEEKLITKLADARENFSEKEIEEHAMICSPVFVVDGFIEKVKRMEEALIFYANESNYRELDRWPYNNMIEDEGHIAREALGIPNE